MKLRIQKLHPNAQEPRYATEGAACFDLTAATVNGATHIGDVVYAGKPVTCGTGLAFEIPDGHVMLVFSRSGHGFKHDLRLANCVGVIDSDYRGEVFAKMTCDNPDDDAPPYKINPGDRIAQAMLIPVEKVEFEVAEQLTLTERGTGGLGSTGTDWSAA